MSLKLARINLLIILLIFHANSLFANQIIFDKIDLGNDSNAQKYISEIGDDKKLKFVIIPYGESKSSSKTSADPNNKKLSVYSLEAMLERKIQIIDVIIDD